LHRSLETLITEKAAAEQQLAQYDSKKAEVEKKLRVDSSRAREENNKTVADLEQIVEAERKRCQEAIDMVRKTLKDKIRVLELQLEDERENDSTFKKDKRKLDQDLKQAYVQLEEHMAAAARDDRRIESLERQITFLKERHDRVNFERANSETVLYSLQRTKEAIKAQYEAAKLVNSRLNSELPADKKISLDAADKQLAQHTADKHSDNQSDKNSDARRHDEPSTQVDTKLFDTSVSLDTNQ